MAANRIFHRRVSIGGVLVALASAVTALMLLLSRHQMVAVLGFGFIFLAAIIIERIIHTTYTLTADGQLVIDKGRLSHVQKIDLNDIQDVRIAGKMSVQGRTVIIEHGDNRLTAICPTLPERFVEELNKRKNDLANDDE